MRLLLGFGKRRARGRAVRIAGCGLLLLGCIEAGMMAAGGMALLGLAAPAGAGGRIWSYTDEQGVTHFTNIRHDGRYQRVAFEKSGSSQGRAPRHGQFDGIIGLTAREQSLQPALVKAVIAAESNFDPAAVSHKGAQGLMQLMPQTAASLGVLDPLHPMENVRGGSVYLRRMLDRYGDLERALAAYNAGPDAVDRYGGVPPYRETQAYVRRVLTYYRHYHGDFAP
ncbi:MAG: lytic transglycosylase domain-containing protein [Myxococcota bacterium]|nr:lytic transglycosylase domain-containing protein [Myxococcota bacterium]MDP7571368.1 lytic transglycosylase domain-containing protein [Myxococcota bacterium]